MEKSYKFCGPKFRKNLTAESASLIHTSQFLYRLGGYMSADLRSMLAQIPQSERSGDVGRALARLIAGRAAAEFERSQGAQEAIAKYNREAFNALPGDKPRGPFQEPNVAQLMQQYESSEPPSEESDPHIEAVQRMRGGIYNG